MRDIGHGNEEIPAKVVIELDAAAERPEPEVSARLSEARRKAVNLAEQRERRLFSIPRWATAGGFATAAVIGVAVSLWYADHRENPMSKGVEEIELISSHDQLDLYEDLEFYRWLAEQRHAG